MGGDGGTRIEDGELVLGCDDLDRSLDFFVSELGFRLDAIWPADDPSVAVLSRGSESGVRLVRSPAPVSRQPAGAGEDPVAMPPGAASLEISHAADTTAGVGRAGMHYRDLLPTRQGGRFVASHILIPAGGDVPDYVHHHRVRFQLIYCAAGWVRVVYEDQGEPFVLEAGDCVLQPPGIRHRVLAASPGLEVVEIGCPAEHATFVEHAMALPTALGASDRRWDGQLFVRHVAASAAWKPWRAAGFEARDTGIGAATSGLAGARVVRVAAGTTSFALPAHDGEFLFWYVLSGTATLSCGGRPDEQLEHGSAVAVPAGAPHGLASVSADLQLLEVALPG